MQLLLHKVVLVPLVAVSPREEMRIPEALDYTMRLVTEACTYGGRAIFSATDLWDLKNLISGATECGKISNERVFELVRSFANRVHLGTESIANPLPQTLERIKEAEMLRVIYLHAQGQSSKGWCCGYRSAMAAAALQSILHTQASGISHTEMTRRTVNYAEQVPTLEGCLNYLRPRFPIAPQRIEKETLALEEHLASLVEMPIFQFPHDTVHIIGDYALGRGGARDMVYFNPRDPILSNVDADTLASVDPQPMQKLIERSILQHFLQTYIQPNQTGAHHFICHLFRPCEHWILISVVKLKNKRPFLLIYDCDNNAIDDDNDATPLIAFFYDKFIRPCDI